MRTPITPPMIAVLVQEALTVLDGMVFDVCESCPACGGPVSGYDTRVRQFARIIDDKGERTIRIFVKRFRCRICGKIVNADEPFYPDTRIGSPIIDLCIAFSRAYGYGRAARRLSAMGVPMDRGQCRHYAAVRVPRFQIMPMYGYPVPQSILSLSMLSGNVPKGGRIVGAEALAACGFPSAGRAALHLPPAGEEGDEGDEEERKEERDPGKPEDGG